jgi:Domain of unknown function (DUF5615)
MIHLLADENLDGRVIRGVLQRLPSVDLIRVQDTELAAAHDREILEWATRQGRVLVTHDAATMIGFVHERIAAGLATCGVIELPKWLSIRQAIDELCFVIEGSTSEEWQGQVLYLPL